MTDAEKKVLADELLTNLCSLLGASSSRVYCLDNNGKASRNIVIRLPNA